MCILRLGPSALTWFSSHELSNPSYGQKKQHPRLGPCPLFEVAMTELNPQNVLALMQKCESPTQFGVVFAAHCLQELTGKATQHEISKYVGVSVATVARKMKSASQENMVGIKRISSHQWWYKTSLSDGSDAQVSAVSPSDSAGHDNTNYQLLSKHKYNTNEEVTIPYGNALAPHLGDMPPVTVTLVRKNEVSMPKVFGPDSLLKTQIESLLVQGKLSPPKKKTPAEKLSLIEGREKRARGRFESKEVSQYNCIDLEFVWRDLWEVEFKGFPRRWLVKDKTLVKKLYQDVGQEEVIRVFTFVLQNWGDLSAHYRIKGAPRVGTIHSFWDSWAKDATEGIATSAKTRPEFNSEDSGRYDPSDPWS